MHYEPLCLNSKHKCQKICVSNDCVIPNAFVCDTCNNHHKQSCNIIPYRELIKNVHVLQGLNQKDIYKYQDFVENTFKMLIKSLQKQFCNFRQMFQHLNASQNIKNFYEQLKKHKQSGITGRRASIMMQEKFPLKNDFKLKSQSHLWTLSSQIIQLQNHVNSKLPYYYSVHDVDQQQSLMIEKQQHKPLKQIQIRYRKYRENIIGGLLQNSIDIFEKLLNKDVYNIQLLYRATQQNFSAKKFHQMCDGKKNTLTLVKTQYGKVAGGFTPLPWSSPTQWEYITDPSQETFVFGLSKSLCQYKFSPYKKKFVVAIHKEYGPAFGDDLVIYDHANVSKGCFSNFPDCFKCPKKDIPHTKQVLMEFVGASDHYQKFNLLEWQVYKISFAKNQQEEPSYLQQYRKI